MDPIWILKQPWFALSPSPFSIGFYGLCGLLGARLIMKSGWRYRSIRLSWLFAFIDSVFLAALVVLVQDSAWLIFNTVKWIIPVYSGVANFWNYYVRFPENVLEFAVCAIVVVPLFKLGIVKVSRSTVFIMSMVFVWLGVQFLLAPNQAYTDWMFAVGYGYPDWLILQGFLLNIGMKALLAVAFYFMFQKQGMEISSKNVIR